MKSQKFQQLQLPYGMVQLYRSIYFGIFKYMRQGPSQAIAQPLVNITITIIIIVIVFTIVIIIVIIIIIIIIITIITIIIIIIIYSTAATRSVARMQQQSETLSWSVINNPSSRRWTNHTEEYIQSVQQKPQLTRPLLICSKNIIYIICSEC